MSGSGTASRGKRIAALLLVVVSLAWAGRTGPARHFLASANDFVRYYRALEETSLRPGFWDRVALSLVLASAECPKTPCAKLTSS